MKLSHLSHALTSANCIGNITDNRWAEFSVLGYFTENAPYIQDDFVNEPNPSFVKIFANKLEMMFSSETPGDFAITDLRNKLYRLAVDAYFGCGVEVMRVYHSVSALIEMHTRHETITIEHVDNIGYRPHLGTAIIIPHMDIENGDYYGLNIEGFPEISAQIRAL